MPNPDREQPRNDLTPKEFAWVVDVEVGDSGGGGAIVKVQAGNAHLAPIDLAIKVDWRSGMERADVEALGLQIAATLFSGLVATLDRERARRAQLGT